MPNFYSDNEDLGFYVEQYIDWEQLFDLVELKGKAEDAPANWEEAAGGYKDVLDLVGEFVAAEVAPRSQAMDQAEIKVDGQGKVTICKEHEEIFAGLQEMGIYGLNLPRELGGMNMPVIIYFMIAEMFGRADVGSMTHFALHGGIAGCLTEYAIREGSAKFDENGRITSIRFEKEIQEMISGKTWGSMDLTEPQAGSDLAAIRARATKDENGLWRVTGNKIFITSGHGNYHLVLAKTEDKNSLEALSLFLIPLQIERDGQTIKNAYVDRVEEKIGHHSSPTCSIQYDNSEAELVGKMGDGFRYMLMLMNNARIGVAFESIGICEAAYRLARDYAAERPSMGKTLDRHEMIADYLDDMKVTIMGIRALAMEAALNEETSRRIDWMQSAGMDAGDPKVRKKKRRAKRRARLLTPLVKYVAAEQAVRLARLSMQIHGGNGYMKDYEAEKLLRDALVLPIYEGTSQIQSLMALKDHLTLILKRPQLFFQRVARAKVNAIRKTDVLERAYWRMRSLALSAQQHIVFEIAKRKWAASGGVPISKLLNTFLKEWNPKRDFSFGMLHAENLTSILADVEIAGVLLEQAKQFPERRDVAKHWMQRAEPRVRYHWDLIMHTGARIVAMLGDKGKKSS